MGNKCFVTTANDRYKLKDLNYAQLKEQWPAIQLYKMKKIFEENARTQGDGEKYLQFRDILSVMPDLGRYQQEQRDRICEICDLEKLGMISWSSFAAFLSLCYYCSRQLLSLQLFMIFDAKLSKRLYYNELILLFDLNAHYIRGGNCIDEDMEDQEMDGDTIVELLLSQRTYLTVEDWIEESPRYIHYGKYRKIFNIFLEQKLEKELVENFEEWNQITDQVTEKYVCYLISRKWFESWRVYVHREYRVELSQEESPAVLRTMITIRTATVVRSMKTSKSINSARSIKPSYQEQKMKEFKLQEKDMGSAHNFDLIQSNIGDKPGEIYNKLLEGEYSQILAPHLVNRVHYLLVSEKVWKTLKKIYGGYPEFRRVGIYPINVFTRTVKIYSKFEDRLDYSEQFEESCQVPKTVSLEKLFLKTGILSIDQLPLYDFYYKTIGMPKWQTITDISMAIGKLSPETIIFLAYISKENSDKFQLQHCRMSTQLNVGDLIYFPDSQRLKRKAVFMGLNSAGKYLIHFLGMSYIYDQSVPQKQLAERVFMYKNTIDIPSKQKLEQVQIDGIHNSNGCGLFNSLLILLFYHNQLKEEIFKFKVDNPKDLLHFLANILYRLRQGGPMHSFIVPELISNCLPRFSSFEATMQEELIEEFTGLLGLELDQNNCKIMEKYEVETLQNSDCLNCNRQTKESSVYHSLTLWLPQDEYRYYEVIYVPYAATMQLSQLRRYSICLQRGATLKDFKLAFEHVADTDNVLYILAEIHGNNIIKKYESVRNDAKLQDLQLYEDDPIYAYELCVKLDNFINDHYFTQVMLRGKNLHVGQLIDFQKQDKTWAFGRVVRIDEQSYTHKLITYVQYYRTRTQLATTSFNPDLVDIAMFPTRSYATAEQYHVRMLQRVYNQTNREMELCNLPLVLVIGSWMRVREVSLLVYQQIRGFIAESYRFMANEKEKDIDCGTHFQIKINDSTTKMSKKQKISKFREYLFGDELPYKVQFTDFYERCLLCFKIYRSPFASYKNQQDQDYICSGCQLDENAPIYWQMKMRQIRVCVDWKKPDCFIKADIMDHSSFLEMRTKRRNNGDFTLQKCLQGRFCARMIANEEIGERQLCCSMAETDIRYEQEIVNLPSRLLIHFNRTADNERHQHMNYRYVSFPMEKLVLKDRCYELVGATAIKRRQTEIKYLTYVNRNGEWLQYDNTKVKLVNRCVVQRICVVILLYQEIQALETCRYLPSKEKLIRMKFSVKQ